VALTAHAGRFDAEGAIIYRLGDASLIEPGRLAVFLRFVASAPRNRYRLVNKAAVHKGVGEELVITAMLESYYSGFEGRVLGDPIPDAVPFYEGLEFRKALDPQDHHAYYEIPKECARAHLVKRGWI
jgi:hypothetical protein